MAAAVSIILKSRPLDNPVARVVQVTYRWSLLQKQRSEVPQPDCIISLNPSIRGKDGPKVAQAHIPVAQMAYVGPFHRARGPERHCLDAGVGHDPLHYCRRTHA